MKKFTLLLSLLFVLITYCDDDGGATSVEDNSGCDGDNLISVSDEGGYTVATLEFLATQAGITLNPKNGIDVYHIEYNTCLPDETILTSAVVFVPQSSNAMPVVELQHGTIFADSQRPTAGVLNGAIEGVYESSQGYVTVVPDGIGFGSSADYFHPYIVAEGYIANGLDAIRAARIFATEEGITLNDKLFLKGYSEGGYATMAVYRAIEQSEELKAEFSLTAVAPGAGPYDLVATGQKLLTSTLPLQSGNRLTTPSYFPFITLAYKDSYPDELSDLTMSDIFAPEYADRIEPLFDGSKTSGDIISALDANDGGKDVYLVDDFFTSSFLSDFTGSTAMAVKDIFLQNSFVDSSDNSLVEEFTVTVPLRLYHCSDDLTVPSSNSDALYAALDGTNNDLVELVTATNPDNLDADPEDYHGTCPLYLTPVEWFDTF